ncbi:hypothetical protein GCM10027052_25840 [Parafrigoribacterium mesophilum]|uniref:nuclease-related domain-containing protein n=1 Tax=Parafrigoribacterium mesophilum TaxID=433646 RepID=UPI0031FD9D5A
MSDETKMATLADRIPGHSVMEELLRSQAVTGPRGTLVRVFGVSPLSADEQSWYSGALGERTVGRMLTGLDENWTVLHAIPVGNGTSDIDHVIIGPGGVFTVNTKHHPGQRVWVAPHTFMVSGQQQPYLRNSEHEAERATKKLYSVLPAGLAAVPVIAVVDAKAITIKERPATVVVLNARSLVRWLRKRPVVLDAGQVASILALAKLPSTWHSSPAEPTDAVTLARGFDALHREVLQARTRRLIWAGAFVAVLVAAMLALAPQIGHLVTGLLSSLTLGG